ncbi:hypothetical protein [Sporolactobacillus putidus]|uniref:Uncharacterized protein n=1 Tax=Sporolactobacillus putidus TaxID=492735 RepID=A0A917RX83_9BACL|nr:hypothetical protein [Sporolactobacillus putidus]GGL41545.1 hypothetical protein GCM10007968_01780 [Sporolactobacillus putidus]
MISYEGNVVNEALEFIRINLHLLGEFKSLLHERDQENVYQKTTIIGTNNTLVVEGKLGHGHNAAGPSALIEVLELLGLNEKNEDKWLVHACDDRPGIKIDYVKKK